jgi:hypothetical protein
MTGDDLGEQATSGAQYSGCFAQCRVAIVRFWEVVERPHEEDGVERLVVEIEPPRVASDTLRSSFSGLDGLVDVPWYRVHEDDLVAAIEQVFRVRARPPADVGNSTAPRQEPLEDVTRP